MSEIEKTKEDIAILQEKLQKLEEAEKQPNMVLLNQCKELFIELNIMKRRRPFTI
jgi:hypothetical protein